MNQNESWNTERSEGENTLSFMAAMGTGSGFEGDTGMSSVGGFTSTCPSLHQSATYPSVSAAWAPHQPPSSSNIWDDTIRFGPSANNNGQTIGYQSLPTTTLPLHVSQAEDSFDFSDFNNDFLLFENTADFNCHSNMSFCPDGMTM